MESLIALLWSFMFPGWASLYLQYYFYLSSPGSGSRQPFCFFLQERDSACWGAKYVQWVGAQGAEEDNNLEALTDTGPPSSTSLCNCKCRLEIWIQREFTRKKSMFCPQWSKTVFINTIKKLTHWVDSFLRFFVWRQALINQVTWGRGASR